MPKGLVATFVFAFAFASAVPTSAQGTQNPPSAPSTKPPTNVGPALPRTVHATLVRSEELPFAEIALNNRSPQPTEVTLTFYSKNGESSEPVKRTLQPGEVKHIDVDNLLPAPLKHQRELGGVFVQYTGQWNQVASQLTLISADRKSSMDQPLRPDTDFRAGLQDAVWYMPNDGDAAIVLGNSSGERIIATLILPDGNSKEIRLRPYETEIIRLHRDSRRASRREERVRSVRVETSAPAGALRAVGYVTFRGFARTIRFYDRATVRQPDLFAANLSTENSEIQIVLKNISDKPLSATPRFLPVGPGAGSGTPQSPLELPAITLAPGEEALVDTTPLEQLTAQNEAYSRVGVHVRNSGEKGTLIGSLASFNRRERLSFEIPLRDSGSLRNSGGSYPIRLDDDYSTFISLMNVSNDAVQFTGIIRHPKGEYVFKPRKLQAGESALFDIKDLRDKKTPDPNGKTLPADFERGQFNWSMHQGGTVPKLIGRSQIVSPSRGVSSSYSCPICCPNSGPYYEFDPTGVLVTVDGFNPFGTNEMTVSCYGVWSGWAKTVSLTSMNPGIATSSYYDEGQANAYGHTPGSTDLTTGYYCNEVYTDDGMDCYSSYPCNNQANAPVNVVGAVNVDATNPASTKVTYRSQQPLSSVTFTAPGKTENRATVDAGDFFFTFDQYNVGVGQSQIRLTAAGGVDVRTTVTRSQRKSPATGVETEEILVQIPLEQDPPTWAWVGVQHDLFERYDMLTYSIPLVSGSKTLRVVSSTASITTPEMPNVPTEIGLWGEQHKYHDNDGDQLVQTMQDVGHSTLPPQSDHYKTKEVFNQVFFKPNNSLTAIGKLTSIFFQSSEGLVAPMSTINTEVDLAIESNWAPF